MFEKFAVERNRNKKNNLNIIINKRLNIQTEWNAFV